MYTFHEHLYTRMCFPMRLYLNWFHPYWSLFIIVSGLNSVNLTVFWTKGLMMKSWRKGRKIHSHLIYLLRTTLNACEKPSCIEDKLGSGMLTGPGARKIAFWDARPHTLKHLAGLPGLFLLSKSVALLYRRPSLRWGEKKAAASEVGAWPGSIVQQGCLPMAGSGKVKLRTPFSQKI